MINIDLSRRVANALRPLLMPFDLRNQFVKTVANSETFNSLPLWCQNVIIYGEKFPNAKETSVPIPRKILPQGFEQSVQYPNSGKSLGTPIGAKPSDELVDGDGDGFIASTPGGADDTRVSPKQEKRPKGEITKGNIDLNNRPVVKNRDGSISTVRSITITEGNTAVVIPTVIKKPNGSGVIVSDQEAIKYYQRRGQHLGKFSNIRDADTYAQNLHNQQAAQYPNPGKSFIGEGVLSFKGVPKPKKKPPTVTSGDINDLAVRVRNNNSKAKMTAKTNLRDLKIVFLRGLEDGSKEVAKKRVYKFLALLNSDKPADVKYFDDNDLLPLDHPWRNRKTSKKWAGFREGEYGVKYSKGCCPRVVKRHYSNTLIL